MALPHEKMPTRKRRGSRKSKELSDEILEKILANPSADLACRKMSFNCAIKLGISRESAISLYGKDAADDPTM